MKHILLLATGGTIACRQTGHGLAPSLTGEQILAFTPALSHICRVTVQNPMSVDSTDMTAEHRQRLARIIWDNRDAYDGFVITHGTDTLAYSAALLEHLLKHFPKPVILTGSMRPMGEDGSDAEENLLGAFRVACAENYAGVAVYVHRQLIRGSHVVKIDSRAVEAFRSVNAPIDGTITGNGTVMIYHRPPAGEPSFTEEIDPCVVVMRLTPDLDPSILDFLGTYRRVILAGYGSGGVPTRLEKVVQKLIVGGTRVYLTTQCVFGGADLHKYKVGRRAEALGAVCLGARTIEDALAAVMCGEL